MKRYQIREQLPANITDAALRRTIKELGFVVEDTYEYSEEQTQTIISRFVSPKSPETQQQQTTQQVPTQPQQPLNEQDAWGQLAHFRNQADTASSELVKASQQSAIQDLQSFQQSAQQFAEFVGTQKALTVASVPAMINEYAVQKLQQIENLKTESSNGFQTQGDLVSWINRWTDVTIQPISLTYNPISGALEAGK